MIDETILTGIQTVGFPIFMCLLLFYDRVKVMGKLEGVIQENTKITAELKTLIQELKK